jgi:hypothetical protein
MRQDGLGQQKSSNDIENRTRVLPDFSTVPQRTTLLRAPYIFKYLYLKNRLCGLVVRVLGYRYRGPGFDSQHYQNKEVLSLERGPLSLLSITEELLDRKVATPV